jgi:hypothetical protein
VDQPAGREVAGVEGDAEDALEELDSEPVWSGEEIEEELVVVEELAVTVDVRLVLVLVITEVDVVLLSAEVLALNAMLDDGERVVDVVLG